MSTEKSETNTESSTMSDEMTTEEYSDVDLDTEDVMTEIIIKPTENVINRIIVPSEKRISKNRMTYYEYVRIIGERTTQLTRGAKPLIKTNPKSNELTYEEIAIEELKLKMIPFKIKRPVKNHYEVWHIDELQIEHLEHLF